MKKIFFFLFVPFFVFTFLPMEVFAGDWVEAAPAGFVNKFWSTVASDSDGSHLIAAVSNGRLYTSDDGGSTWTERQPAGDANKFWSAVASDSDGSNLIAAMTSGRLYTSDDGGSTWTERQPAGNADKSWQAVSSDSDGSHLIAGVTGGRLYTSDNGGSTWTERQPAGNADKSWQAVSSDSDGSHLIAAVYFGRLYTSDNGGSTWTERQPAGNADKVWRAVSSDSDGSNLIAAVYNGRLYTSSNSGVDWTERQPAGDANKFWSAVASDDDGSNLIAAAYGRLYTSDDGGGTWTERQPAGNTDQSWQAVSSDSDGSNLITAGYNGRLYISPEDGVPLAITSLDPADNATSIALDSALTITFNKEIAKGSGNITIHKASDDSVAETIDVASAQVTISGANALVIDAADFEAGVEYYIQIDSGAIKDLGDNDFIGIADTTTWSFTPLDEPIFTFERASVADDGTESDDGSYYTAVSGNGRYVAFQSYATNLVPGYTNSGNVYVYDRETDTIEVVSKANDGTEANSSTDMRPAISDDGRYVAFQSYADNLVPGYTNSGNVYVYDRETDTIEVVSKADDGTEANSSCDYGVAISGDGRYVVFDSYASNLVPGDTNGRVDIFVYDRDTDTIERVSVASDGTQANGHSNNYSESPMDISYDGRYVTFNSTATNLVPGDTNGNTDVFVYDRDLDTIERVSVADDGTQGNDDSLYQSISSDGRYVVFGSAASNLVAEDTNTRSDIFLYDRDTDTLEKISNHDSLYSAYYSDISGDGVSVVYYLNHTSVGVQDAIIVHNREANTNLNITEGADRENGAMSLFDYPVISGDGTVVVFSSDATNLVENDTNEYPDIFVWEEESEEPPAEEEPVSGGGTSYNRLRVSTADDTGDTAIKAILEQLVTLLQQLIAQLIAEQQN